MPRPFLTARWSNVCLVTYAVPPGVLEPRLPPGLVLDTRHDQAFVSLVAFEFLETRVLGVSWPRFTDFVEMNLRFYVRRPPSERGVVFIREFVPQPLVAWVARRGYNEPYQAAPLGASVRETLTSLTVEYWIHRGGRTHTLRVLGEKPGRRPGDRSDEHFFKEHQWGYGRNAAGGCVRYEVRHPVWDVYPVQSAVVDVEWQALYGPEWGFLDGASPYSVILAAGSPVTVRGKRALGPG